MDAPGHLDFTALTTMVTAATPPLVPPEPPGAVPSAVQAAVRETIDMWSPELMVTAATYARALFDSMLRSLDDKRDWPVVPIALRIHPDRWYRAGSIRTCLDDEAWDVGISCVQALGHFRDCDNDGRIGPSGPEWTQRTRPRPRSSLSNLTPTGPTPSIAIRRSRCARIWSSTTRPRPARFDAVVDEPALLDHRQPFVVD